MWWFLLGFMCGGWFGFTVCAAFVAGARADEQADEQFEQLLRREP